MSALPVEQALARVAVGDHAACAFGSDAERQAIVGRFVRDAQRSGQHVLYVADEPGTGPADVELAGFDTDLLAAARRSRQAGSTALAVIAQLGPQADELRAEYESRVDRLLATADARVVCLYDRRRFAEPVLERALAAHPVAVRTDRAAVRVGTVTLVERDGRVSLSGELDAAAAAYVRVRLEECVDGAAEAVVDLTGLSFIDVAGGRALVAAAARLRRDGRLVLAGPRRAVRRVLVLCGWADDPRLDIREAT